MLVHPNFNKWIKDKNIAPSKGLLEMLLSAFNAGQETMPDINAMFEVVSDNITGTTLAPVKRVEKQDDGSFTVVIDHWPENND